MLFTRRSLAEAEVPATDGLDPATARVVVRLTNVRPAALRLRDLRSPAIGRLVQVTGAVVRASGVRPLVTGLDFECPKCGASTSVEFEGGAYAPPAGCVAPGCKARAMVPVHSSARTVDWQRIRLQASLNRVGEGRRGRGGGCGLAGPPPT